MSFGFFRSEVLGALFSTLVIWILTGVLVYLAVLRVINQDFEIEPIYMVATALLGVLFNISKSYRSRNRVSLSSSSIKLIASIKLFAKSHVLCAAFEPVL